jgi:hypothetical protein
MVKYIHAERNLESGERVKKEVNVFFIVVSNGNAFGIGRPGDESTCGEHDSVLGWSNQKFN